ncbi:MAG TPA: hypothetical protein VGU19_16920, partial [Microvirga sp.]|nr:hypothetical protein [Microvirga sp.]
EKVHSWQRGRTGGEPLRFLPLCALPWQSHNERGRKKFTSNSQVLQNRFEPVKNKASGHKKARPKPGFLNDRKASNQAASS